jgi:VWFA-related protein
MTRRDWIALAAPQFTAGVKVVNVFATVREPGGRLRNDLGKESFLLAENGHPQEIRYFSRETDLPLTIGLMVDTSMSQEGVIAAERAASFRFLDRVLRETKDRVFIMQFDLGIHVAQGLTASRRDFDEALSLVDTPARAEAAVLTARGTLLFDAVVRAAAILKPVQNRKAVILMSDGVDVGSSAGFGEAVEAAHKSEMSIYSILFGGTAGRRALERLSAESGGLLFEVTRRSGIEQAFAAIEEELRNQYSIGYVSDHPVRIPGFRRIDLKTAPKELRVRARTRYWAE